jgi:predicted NAD/FAD-binding protein
MSEPQRIAVVGSGISGLLSAYLWSQKAEVTLYEARKRIGGHTHTHPISMGGRTHPVDSGFIVLNDRTYPTLHRFFKVLNVSVQDAEMSFSFYRQDRNAYYAGNNLNGLFAQRSNLFSPRFYCFLWHVYRFGHQALADLEKGLALDVTLGDYLTRINAHPRLVQEYILPMVASIWSAPDQVLMAHPAHAILSFMKHHGLLDLTDRPQWQTVVGGSDQYIKACLANRPITIVSDQPIERIARAAHGAIVTGQDGVQERFDRVIVAVHADQVLPLLDQPQPWEEAFFSTWRYEKNEVLIHTDSRWMPPHRRAWASWNYFQSQTHRKNKLVMTYYMNLLQGLDAPKDIFVTLNAQDLIDPEKVLEGVSYKHPIFSSTSLKARELFLTRHPKHDCVQYVGAYFGYGFHEDGARSALRIGEEHGLTL